MFKTQKDEGLIEVPPRQRKRSEDELSFIEELESLEVDESMRTRLDEETLEKAYNVMKNIVYSYKRKNPPRKFSMRKSKNPLVYRIWRVE